VPTYQLGRKQVFAGGIGNILEWYDFAVYGFLAPIVGKAFFPSDDAVASLLAAYGALAVGYASRPLGSLIFGHIGDHIGRKPALMLSVAMMGGATLAIGVLPTHAEIGVAAAAILVLLRAIQGISVAGEYSSSAVLLVEQASRARRGLIGSLIVAACNCGFLLGSAVGALVSNLLGEAQMNAWGWRVPFFVGAAIALYALFLRRGLEESAVIENADATARLPVLEAVRDHWREIVQIVCLVLPTAVTYFVCFVYATSYLTERMHYSTAKALDMSTLALILLVLVSPVAGLASDRVGRRPVMFFATVASFLFTWPLWYVFNLGDPVWILFVQLSFAAINGVGWAMTVPIMVELSPARTRCSTAGIGYNLCLALFGGTTPWVATYLVARTNDDFAPAYYIMAVAAIAFVATLYLPEMAAKSLRA
jgi:MFS transporter, MHS family, proline/betaine transporter